VLLLLIENRLTKNSVKNGTPFDQHHEEWEIYESYWSSTLVTENITKCLAKEHLQENAIFNWKENEVFNCLFSLIIGKEARKKELKKNKKQRQLVRAAVLKGKDPAQIIEEMEKIDQMG